MDIGTDTETESKRTKFISHRSTFYSHPLPQLSHLDLALPMTLPSRSILRDLCGMFEQMHIKYMIINTRQAQ